MENASKALIIAGAILLSILIIGIGMVIFNSASDTMDKTASRMSEQEKQTHNQKFQPFEGSRRSGTDVKTLINVLIQNYSTQVTNGELGRAPEVNYTGTANVQIDQGAEDVGNKFNDILRDIKMTRTYDVVVSVDAASGIVDKITITEQ